MQQTAQPDLRRTVKTYVKRAGRMTEAQERDYKRLSSVYCLVPQNNFLDFETVFGNRNPVTVEIGFGMGKATAIIARQNPAQNYLGLEVHRAGVGRLLGEIEAHALRNLRILEHDALEVLSLMIKDASLAALHVFFPDPWPKKKHAKRRLMQRPVTELLAKKLSCGGYLYMATDWQPYAEFALAELGATAGLANEYAAFAPHQNWRPETRFEEKGKNADRQIFELFFRRTPHE